MSAVPDLDALDRRLLSALRRDARQSHVALADEIGLSASQCARRIRRLEELGVIAGYTVRLDPRTLGRGVSAFISVTLERHGQATADAFHSKIAALDEVVECVSITGDADYLLRVAASDLDALWRFISGELMTIREIRDIRSSITLAEIKPFGGPSV